MTARKALMSWSSGKDSAWALHTVMQDPDYDVVGLFCTINKKFDRVAMHAVRLELLRQQADRIGLPLQIIELPFPCSNEDYERIMGDFVAGVQESDVDCFIFGDLYLEDVRDYRLEKLNGTGIDAHFPIWGMPTEALARTMIDAGVKTVITCVDPKQLDQSFAGRFYDAAFLADLPNGADPCGENGEFHSFVFDGPMFSSPIAIHVGEVVERDGFHFVDVLPATADLPDSAG